MKAQERNFSIDKRMLTFKEACTYTAFKPSYMHKLTAARRIPFYKPTGKKIFFDKEELDSWIKSGRIETADFISDKAKKQYCILYPRSR